MQRQDYRCIPRGRKGQPACTRYSFNGGDTLEEANNLFEAMMGMRNHATTENGFNSPRRSPPSHALRWPIAAT